MKKLIATILLGLLVVCPAMAQEKKPFVLGEVRELYSTQLSEKRTLNIYLPEGYNAKDSTRYPVIYLLDGSANEDFVHIAGLVQFFNMMEMMPKVIVVGIANTDRKRDMTFPTTIEKDKKEYPSTGGSAKFIAFIEQELQPFIKKQYTTNGSAMLIGQSLGGLLATEVLFKKPALFSSYIIVSPSLWWDGESLLKVKPAADKVHPNTPVFVIGGKEGEIMERVAKELAEILKTNKNINLTYHYMPDEDHATILHHAVYDAFKTLY